MDFFFLRGNNGESGLLKDKKDHLQRFVMD